MAPERVTHLDMSYLSVPCTPLYLSNFLQTKNILCIIARRTVVILGGHVVISTAMRGPSMVLVLCLILLFPLLGLSIPRVVCAWLFDHGLTTTTNHHNTRRVLRVGGRVPDSFCHVAKNLRSVPPAGGHLHLREGVPEGCAVGVALRQFPHRRLH